MNGAVSGMRSGFRSPLCRIVCIRSDWARPEMYFSQRTPYPLFSDTKTNIFYAFVVHRAWEIDTVSTVPKVHLCSQENRRLSTAEYTCPISGLECKCDPQHIFWKWPIRMSNEDYDNILLHLTHTHEPKGRKKNHSFNSLVYGGNVCH